eukprot:IDg12525t1
MRRLWRRRRLFRRVVADGARLDVLETRKCQLSAQRDEKPGYVEQRGLVAPREEA